MTTFQCKSLRLTWNIQELAVDKKPFVIMPFPIAALHVPSGPKKLHTVFIAITLSTLNQFL